MVYWYEGLVLYIVSFLVHTYAVDPSCECVVFQSYGLSDGKFKSPNFPKPYEANINCVLYSFIGDVNEIVEITFTDLDLRPPKEYSQTLKQQETLSFGDVINGHIENKVFGMTCEDRLRIFSSLDRPAVNEHSIADDEICGDMSSLEDKKIYSRTRALIMEFHTSSYPGERKHKGFEGFFRFLEKSTFKTTGQLQFGSQCSYVFHYDNRVTSGKFFSPRFPQKYAPSSNCQYIFIGHEQDTVHLIFKKISLPLSRKKNCDETGDYIRVYDGKDYNAKVLRTFCNSAEEVHVFSSGQNVFVEFRSDWSIQKQGFSAEYTFIKKTYRPENDTSMTNASPRNGCAELTSSQQYFRYMETVGTEAGRLHIILINRRTSRNANPVIMSARRL